MAFVMTCKILSEILFNILWKLVCSWLNFVSTLRRTCWKVSVGWSILVVLDIGQFSIILVSGVNITIIVFLKLIGPFLYRFTCGILCKLLIIKCHVRLDHDKSVESNYVLCCCKAQFRSDNFPLNIKDYIFSETRQYVRPARIYWDVNEDWDNED